MKRTIKTTLCAMLIVALLATGLVTYAIAAGNDTAEPVSTTSTIYYPFYLDLPAYGVVDLATPRKKEHPATAATFALTKQDVSSPYNAYINVRNSAGTAIVGTAKTLYSGEAVPRSFAVAYLSGYGNVGTYYRPSGQTSSNSTRTASIDGSWRP